MCVWSAAQLCPTLCDPTDYSSPVFSVHGIFQARILEWVAISSSRGSSWPRDWTHISGISCIAFNECLSYVQRASLVAQRLKRLPAMQETLVRSPGQEDPLEKEMTTYSSILAWRIPWTEEPGGLQSTGSQRVRHDWETSLYHMFNILI